MSSQYINLPAYGSPSWRAPVASATDLPATGNTVGDAIVAEDTSIIYVWSGSAWVAESGSGGVTSLNTLTGALTLAAGANISITPSGGNTLTIAASSGGSYTFADSLVNTSGTVTLVNDSATPGDSKYYGTNASGTLGYFALPAGTVTSVGLADTSTTAIYTISNSPITTSGTIDLTLNTQTANNVFAGPTTGAAAQPSFRALVAADIPSLSATYLPLAGGTMTGAILTPNGSASSPSLQVGTTAGNGLYSRTANVVNISADSAKTIEVYNDGTNSGLAIGLTSTATAGFSFYIVNGSSGHYYMTDGGVQFMNYGVATSFIKWGYNAGSANNYLFELDHSSTNLNPANETAGGVTYIDPVYTAINTQNTASNYQGFQTAGSSKNLNGGLYVYNDTQTSGSETSHMELWTANSGTFAKKLSISATGQVATQIAGSGYSVKTGSNCKMGTAVLSGGTVTVTNSSITSSSIVFLTPQMAGGTQGVPTLGTVVAGTSFVINSSSALDTSTVAYLIMEPS